MRISRLILAGLLAGTAVFVWGVISHVLLGLGQTAIRTIPDESAVLTVFKENIREPGFYFFPGGMETIQHAPQEQQQMLMKQYEEIYKTQPHGILVISPPTGKFYSFPKLLMVEFASNLAGGLIAAWLLSLSLGSLSSFAGRIVFVALLGVFASLAIDLSYWNWYDFPGDYTRAVLIDNTVAWAVAGTVLAVLFRRRFSPPETNSAV